MEERMEKGRKRNECVGGGWKEGREEEGGKGRKVLQHSVSEDGITLASIDFSRSSEAAFSPHTSGDI